MGVIIDFSGAALVQVASGEQGGQEATGMPGDVGVLIEPSGATMDQETKVEQGDRETGGRFEVDKSAEGGGKGDGGPEVRRLRAMGRRCRRTQSEGSRLERTGAWAVVERRRKTNLF